MEIVKIDPDEKYVLVMPDANAAQAERILDALRSFIKDGVHVVMAIYGVRVTFVPVDQVVGYKVLGDVRDHQAG